MSSPPSTSFSSFYPYWDGAKLEQWAAFVRGLHRRTLADASGRPVWVAETGWPSCGDPVEAAVPSLANAAAYLLNFVSWARANYLPYFYFEALHEAWKPACEGLAGACWGVLDRKGRLKAGTEAAFEGRTVPDNWSDAFIPGGPGQPTIEFTFVPPRNTHENLRGQAWHVKPVDYAVAVHILVTGRWWTKPCFSQPTTVIRPAGIWPCDITTGGMAPPAELEQNAAAGVIVTP